MRMAQASFSSETCKSKPRYICLCCTANKAIFFSPHTSPFIISENAPVPSPPIAGPAKIRRGPSGLCEDARSLVSWLWHAKDHEHAPPPPPPLSRIANMKTKYSVNHGQERSKRVLDRIFPYGLIFSKNPALSKYLKSRKGTTRLSGSVMRSYLRKCARHFSLGLEIRPSQHETRERKAPDVHPAYPTDA